MYTCAMTSRMLSLAVGLLLFQRKAFSCHGNCSCNNSTMYCTNITLATAPANPLSDVNNEQRQTHYVLTRKNISFLNISIASSSSLSLFEENNVLQSFICILSISAILVNVLTMTVIFSKPQLKSLSTIYLAGHVAVCDLLIALYLLVAVIHTVVLSILDDQTRQYSDNWQKFVCPLTISVRSIGQLVEPVVLFFMTLDRYKRIVNFSKPPPRYRSISIATNLIWFAAIVVVFGSLSVLFGKQSFSGALCSRTDTSAKTIDSYVERVLIISSSILFITCCGMYFRIYRVVKNQNQRMGTQAYVRVSNVIFALVLSTFVLWFVPAMVVAFIGSQDSSMKEIRQLIIVSSFTTNSLVNPFIYVFREKKFQRVAFSWLNRTCSKRRGMPAGNKVTSFRIDSAINENNVTNLGNSNETEQFFTTSL
ncbi:G-protein coupled receptor 12-like [Stylophora pistillata]|uniref:G-protein coupled receptor 12-like n=1 Tax=Stylophora pistillata TaxID=50429 RepID=UPI000C039B92|nr:G-protein coupled receptor 12-like [Stylophora pistillata]